MWQFCAALNRYGVDYVVIGSEAVAFHGGPRFSVDFDVFVRPTAANLRRVKAALEASGLGDLSEVDPEVWAKSCALLRIGEPPLQIDILLQISGIDYHAATTDAWRDQRVTARSGGNSACESKRWGHLVTRSG